MLAPILLTIVAPAIGHVNVNQDALTPWVKTDNNIRTTQSAVVADVTTSYNERSTQVAVEPWVVTAFDTRTNQSALVAWVITCSSSSYTPPPSTGEITLSAVASGIVVDLTWTSILPTGEFTYNVERSLVSGGPYTTLATGITGLSYVDTTVLPTTLYYYVVVGINACGDTSKSNQASVTTAPATPYNLAAVGECDSTIALTWFQSGLWNSFIIYRSTDGITYTEYATSTLLAYADTVTTPWDVYYYEVQAVYGGSQSGLSLPASAFSFTVPAAPTGLSTQVFPGAIAIFATPSAHATSYNIYRGIVSEGETLIATGLPSPYYYDSSVQESTLTFYYYFTAVDQCGESVPSDEVSAAPLPWMCEDRYTTDTPPPTTYNTYTAPKNPYNI